MQKENSAISAFKIWVFPSLVSIVSLMIWNDVNEIKADVKALMAQSNVDKTRIDNLERQIFKQTSNFPDEDKPLEIKTMYAVLPSNDEWKKVKTKKIKYDFKQWLLDLFKDERGSTSIKPVVGFMGALFLCVTLTANSFTHGDIKPSDALVEAVLIMTCVGIGADSIDKFSHKKRKKMRLNKYGIILLVVIGLFLISRLGCNNGLGFFDKPKADTVRVIDTLWEQHDTTIYKKVPVKEIIYDIDTLPPQYIPDTNYAALKLQYEALVKEHASKAIFFDTIKLAELKGGFYLKDTVQFNRLAGRSVEAKYEIPVVKETVTITKQAPKRNQLYIGAGINTSKTLMPQAAEAGLILKTKRDQIYGLKAGSDINGNISYGFQSYWKIGKKDK